MAALTALFVIAPPMLTPASVNRPYSLHSITLHTPEVRPNEPLIYTTVGQKLRPCRNDIAFSLYDLGENILIWRDQAHAVRRLVTKTPVVNRSKFVLPPNLPAGSYRLHATMHSKCGGGEVHAIELPDLDFKVVT